MRKLVDYLLVFMTYFATIITFLTFLFILLYIIYKGLPNLDLSLFSLNYTSENSSVIPSLITTF